MFLIPSDFVGKFQLHRGMYDVEKLESYIERYEKKYLAQLFGVDLYNEFISDLGVGNAPKSLNFQKVFNPFIETLGLDSVAISEGILDMLKGFIYFEYAKDLYNQMTPFGQTMPQSENSVVVPTLNNLMYSRYNESVKTYRAIQAYIISNWTSPFGEVIDFWYPNIGQGYTQNYYQVAYEGGSGTGFIADVKMVLVNGVAQANVVDNGSNYNSVNSSTSGGSGFGCIVTPIVSGGSVTSLSIFNSGEGYALSETLTILGGDDNATFTITELGIGSVQSMTNIKGGNGYVVGDLLVLNADDEEVTNAVLEVLYAGKGDFTKFNGVNLQYAYWL